MSELEAGRELDALVKTRVMGYRRITGVDVPPDQRHRDATIDEQVVWLSPEGRWQCALCNGDPEEEYSTDITDAWEVVEHLNRNGFEIYYDPRVGLWRTGFIANRWENGVTAPLAICRAALAAVANQTTSSR